MPYWGRLETSDRDHKPIKELFTEVVNQMRSGADFSYAYIKSDFLQPVEFSPRSWMLFSQ